MESEIFKALGDPTRMKIIEMLAEEGELCVCKIYESLPISQPGVSKQLIVLKKAGLVNDRREGKWIHYSLNKNKLKRAIRLLAKIA